MNEYQPLLCQVYLCNLNISEKTDREIELSEKTLKYQHWSIYRLHVDSTIHTLTITCFLIVHNLKYYYSEKFSQLQQIHVYISTYIYVYIQIYMYIYTHIHISYICTYSYVYIYIYVRIYTSTYTYTSITKRPKKNVQVCQRAMTRGGTWRAGSQVEENLVISREIPRSTTKRMYKTQ